MMRPAGHPVVIAAVVVVTTVAVATADDADSSSDEDLHQALALVNILKSVIMRRSQGRFAATPSSLADFAGYRPWPPPGVPFYEYGPFRRMSGTGDYQLRKDKNITRQMEYEDPFGPHPGGDEPGTSAKTTEGSTSAQAKSTLTATTNDGKINSIPPSTIKAKTPKAAETKTKKKSATERSATTTKAIIPSAKPSEIRKTKKPTKMHTKPNKNIVSDKTTTNISPSNKGGIVKLKYNKNDAAKNAIQHKRADNAEIAEAAIELKRETADMTSVVEPRCGPRKSASGLDPIGAPPNGTQTTCVGPNCKKDNATKATTVRFKATTRVYLSRSVRPPIPLPANNAFCYTNPENALCRTLI